MKGLHPKSTLLEYHSATLTAPSHTHPVYVLTLAYVEAVAILRLYADNLAT